MSHSLFCPQCQHLLLQPDQGVLQGHCPNCGWQGLPQYTTLLPAPTTPLQKGFLKQGMGRLLLASLGSLLSFLDGKWEPIALPGAWTINGLIFIDQIILIGPGEEHTLGDPKPLIAMEPQTGHIVWQVESDGIQWTAPAGNESFACAVDSRGQVAVVHPHTGQPCWSRSISLSSFPRLGISPALSASFLLLTDATGELIWFSRSDGREMGRFLPAAGTLDFPPTCADNIAYVCAGEGLYRLDLENNQATEIFRVPRKASRAFFASPLVTSHGLIIANADLGKNGLSTYALQLLDPETGQSLWRVVLQRHPYFAPIVEREWVFLPDRRGNILIINLTDGKILDRLPLHGKKPASSPLFMNNELFILTDSGVLCFSSDLQLKHLPDTPQEYLTRGEWESAALKYALTGSLNDAANLYKIHQRYSEARALYRLVDNTRELEQLALHHVDFHLTLRPHGDGDLEEDLFALLDMEIKNTGIGTAKDVRLSLASEQMYIKQPRHRFGDMAAGEEKVWDTLQIRPKAGGGLLLEITISYKDENNKLRKLTFEQGLNVLKSPKLTDRVINITIDGDVSGNLIVGDKNSIQNSRKGK